MPSPTDRIRPAPRPERTGDPDPLPLHGAIPPPPRRWRFTDWAML